MYQKHLEGLCKHPRVSDLARWGWCLRVCLSSKFPGDGDPSIRDQILWTTVTNKIFIFWLHFILFSILIDLLILLNFKCLNSGVYLCVRWKYTYVHISWRVIFRQYSLTATLTAGEEIREWYLLYSFVTFISGVFGKTAFLAIWYCYIEMKIIFYISVLISSHLVNPLVILILRLQDFACWFLQFNFLIFTVVCFISGLYQTLITHSHVDGQLLV